MLPGCKGNYSCQTRHLVWLVIGMLLIGVFFIIVVAKTLEHSEEDFKTWDVFEQPYGSDAVSGSGEN